MKTRLLSFFIVLCIIIKVQNTNAQEFKTALEYLSYMTEVHKTINKDVWKFVSASAHSSSENKIALKKSEMLKTVRDSEDKIRQMPDFKGNTVLRDSMAEYLKLVFAVMNDDYGQIVDMEAVAEDSYDLMETYLKVKEVVNAKLDAAGQRIDKIEQQFAKQHNITLTTELSDIGKKLEEAGKVIKYYNAIYLIFFKSYKESEFLWTNHKKNDMLAAQQSKSNLIKFSEEGIKSLQKIQSYKGDGSLKKACNDILQFYQKQEVPYFDMLTEYNMKQEQFEKIKKVIDSKKQEELTEKDVKDFNDKVNEMNVLVKKVNAQTDIQNTKSTELLKAWNSSAKSFLDKNIP